MERIAVYRSRTDAASVLVPAGFVTRVLAWLLDAFAIGAIVTLLTAGHPLPVIEQGPAGVAHPTHALDTLVSFAYFTLFWSVLGGGRTPGMRLLGMRVVDASGASIGYGAAVVRFVGLVAACIPLLVGVLWVAFDARGQGWHDKVAGTYVVTGASAGDSTVIVQHGIAVAARARGTGHAAVSLVGIVGGLLGAVATALVGNGDAAVSRSDVSLPAAFALAGLIGAVVAWQRLLAGTALLAVSVIGYLAVLGPAWSSWIAGLTAATNAGPMLEQLYWEQAPAMAVFALSGVLLALALVGGVVAALGAGSDRYEA